MDKMLSSNKKNDAGVLVTAIANLRGWL